jgi:hypothetical protein
MHKPAPATRHRTTLEPGTRVRILVRSLNPTPVEGSIVALGPDTLRIVATGFRHRNVNVPIDSVSTLEVSHKSHIWMIPGGVVGYALGYGVGYLLSDNRVDSCPIISALECEYQEKQATGSLSAIMGALIGVGIGWSLTPDRWEAVPLKNVRVSWAPGGRARLSVSLAVP